MEPGLLFPGSFDGESGDLPITEDPASDIGDEDDDDDDDEDDDDDDALL